MGVISGLSEINAIGHRVVHGGETYSEAVVIDDGVKAKITEYIELAPLHNGPGLLGIEACEALMPGIPQVAVFDTAFHQTMPEKAFLYGIDYKYYEKYQIRRYGMHGTSHKYVASEAAKMVGKPLEELKIVTCHLGSGASITAIDKGKVVDTSMGFTPLEGLLMGTRSGNIDPAAVLYIMEKDNLDVTAMNEELNKHSGVLGVSGGLSNDFRDLEDAMEKGDAAAQRAFDLFVYRIKRFIGSYMATLNGLDVLVFTAGIGENDPLVRSAVCQDMDALGIAINESLNDGVRGKLLDISAPESKTKVLIIPTDEELAIAQESLAALSK